MHHELLRLPRSPRPLPSPGAEAASRSASESAAHAVRLRAMAEAHFDGLWRFMRRLGVLPMDLEDAMQEVIVVAASKLDGIAAASERSFLFGTAVRVAAEWRRFRSSRREVDASELAEHADPVPSADALLDQARARTLLDEVLAELPLDVRAVFALYEIEELTMAEIAAVLALPPGTVASQLRRGRELFEAHVTRLQARMARTGQARETRARIKRGSP